MDSILILLLLAFVACLLLVVAIWRSPQDEWPENVGLFQGTFWTTVGIALAYLVGRYA